MEHNESIKCVVNKCNYNCQQDDYCTLNSINVVKNESNTHCVECSVVEVLKENNI